jgi:hypothetical protein
MYTKLPPDVINLSSDSVVKDRIPRFHVLGTLNQKLKALRHHPTKRGSGRHKGQDSVVPITID